MLIIGLTGFKRSGKNTVANMIKEWISFEMRIGSNEIAFADPVVEIGCGVLGICVSEWELLKQSTVQIQLPSNTITTDGRDVVREFGMALVDANPSLLIDSVEERLNPSMVNVITDVRRPHEQTWLVDQQSDTTTVHMLHIERDGVTSDGHVTETPLDKVEGISYVIHNDGSVFDLREQVFDWCEDVLYKSLKEKQCH